ncbi:MAG: extracellular solute-binding protein, partial [Proteobacteria bacterium]|nr:extracellular solute-binding protein [Pseudomonadota bacterium]
MTWRGAALAVTLAGLALGLDACSRHGPAPLERHLAIYNWADYIGTTTIADFERETGIHVEYDTFDADSTLEAKMLAGGAGYDVVSTSENFFSRQIKAGAYQALDRRRLPNWVNADPEVLKTLARFDPGNAHAAPYLHSWTGFAYNAPMIRTRMPDAPVDSLAMLFDPEVVRRFADCGVTLIDGADPVLRLALIYLHLDPDSDREDDLRAAEAAIMRVRPYVAHFDSLYINALATGETCLAMAWSGDFAVAIDRARAAGVELPLKFTLPREGVDYLINGWLIPFDAPHVAEAHEFINYMLRPDVIAKVTNDTHY